MTYLVDTLNPTGYAQVVYESFSGGTAGNREQNHAYVYGLELISQVRSYQASFNNLTQRIYYVYDVHGSVRALTDPTGAVTDTYDYDAFGNLIHSSTTLSSPTPNNYLFAGEQFDSDLGLYYNRARYLNVSTGRFWSIDTDEGDDEAPLSLHKYLYAALDPVDGRDPSGHDGFVDALTSAAIQTTLFVSAHPILTAVSTAVLLSLAPADFVQSLPPDFGEGIQLISAVEAEATELTSIRRLLSGSWLDKLKAGQNFESWMLTRILAGIDKQVGLVVKDGAIVEGQARIKGSAVIDAIINNVITEFKTSFGALNKYQAQQFARYAEQSGQTLEYAFLYKPSPEQIAKLQAWIKEISPQIHLAVTYILDQ
jgi:RHS repeat-associated protein